ncbi:GNAT family N-acetyltransferase [Actinoplanes sp. NPDC051411]|uniref:GNAT family N-acetyltransferase n=1 Tax=Actinoplanes sp. NPDC051411 TaxID=3155522 RepID=UPI0034258413
MDGDLRRLEVRQCTLPDVAALEEQLPSGPNRFHEVRFRRPGSTFLVALWDGVAVGCGEVLWDGPKEPDVRARFPDCPEVNGLAVASDRQSRGIGTGITGPPNSSPPGVVSAGPGWASTTAIRAPRPSTCGSATGRPASTTWTVTPSSTTAAATTSLTRAGS